MEISKDKFAKLWLQLRDKKNAHKKPLTPPKEKTKK